MSVHTGSDGLRPLKDLPWFIFCGHRVICNPCLGCPSIGGILPMYVEAPHQLPSAQGNALLKFCYYLGKVKVSMYLVLLAETVSTWFDTPGRSTPLHYVFAATNSHRCYRPVRVQAGSLLVMLGKCTRMLHSYQVVALLALPACCLLNKKSEKVLFHGGQQ